MNARASKKSLLLGVGALLFLGMFVYWPGVYGGFIFDDFPNLVDDPDWKATSLDIDVWRRALTEGISSSTGRPLAMASFAINYFFTGMNPFGLKLTGIALHLLTGILILLLCRQLIAMMAAHDQTSRMGNYAATAIAVAWTLHPLQISTVLYVVQRMEIGAATGTVLALIAYVRGRRLQIDSGDRYWRWFFLAAIGLGFGMGFKESAVLAPGYMLLIEVFAFKFRTRGGRISRPLQCLYGVGVIVALGVFLTKTLPSALAPGAYASRDFGMTERLLSQAHAILLYLVQILAPIPDRLTFYYDNFPISTGLLSPSSTLIGFLAIAVLALFAWWSRHRFPLIGFGIGWFFLAHALTSNVLPLELVFEHRNYLALFGILLVVGQVLAALTRQLTLEARRTLAALPVIGLSILCALQAYTWADPFRLALTLENRNPSSLRASYGLGMLMAQRAGNQDSPLYSMALTQFEHASRLPSRSPLPEQAIVQMLSTSGRPVPSAVWDRFRDKLKAGRAGPEQISALHGVLECRIRQLCRFDDAQLFHTFLAALESDPNSAVIHSLYANFAWNVMGDQALAIEIMQHAANLAPGDRRFANNLAAFLAAQKKTRD